MAPARRGRARTSDGQTVECICWRGDPRRKRSYRRAWRPGLWRPLPHRLRRRLARLFLSQRNNRGTEASPPLRRARPLAQKRRNGPAGVRWLHRRRSRRHAFHQYASDPPPQPHPAIRNRQAQDALRPFDSFEPTVDGQHYTCLKDGKLYRYEAEDRSFTADLPVDADGLVIDYPTLFQRLSPETI